MLALYISIFSLLDIVAPMCNIVLLTMTSCDNICNLCAYVLLSKVTNITLLSVDKSYIFVKLIILVWPHHILFLLTLDGYSNIYAIY